MVVPPVVISQVYTSGGETGATYKNDFIELFNRGTVSINLTGWSVQYTTATGTTWQQTNLTGVTLLPGQHYLVREASAGSNGSDLPTANVAGGISMSAVGGKVALLSTTVLTVGSIPCPTSPRVVDLVGYGSATNCYEGLNPAPAPAPTSADLRNGGGCVDTNDNGADFAPGTPNPRNTSTTLTPCCSGLQFSASSYSAPEAIG